MLLLLCSSVACLLNCNDYDCTSMCINNSANNFSSFLLIFSLFPGFAVALDVILSNESIAVSMNSASGYLENDFLAQVASSKSDLEPRANDCMKVCARMTYNVIQ